MALNTFLIHFFIFFLFLISFSLSFDTNYCSLNGEGVWAIGLLKGSTLFDLHSPHGIKKSDGGKCSRNPIISCIDVMDAPTAFVADPFLYVENNLLMNPWYAFFELKNMNWTEDLRGRRGQIGVSVSYDQGKHWHYLKVVLKAPVHVSYPFVFKYHDSYYMLPQGHSVSYYKAAPFPTTWVHHSRVHNRVLNDCTIVEYNGYWWLFALFEPNSDRRDWFLHILYASTPLGPWDDTPNNCFPAAGGNVTCVGLNVTTPHRRGHTGVRPGGSMFIHQNKLYRMVQNSADMYGDSMDLYHITSLTTFGILEDHIVPDFRTNLRSNGNVGEWNSMRYHHVDLHELRVVSPKGVRHEWVGLFDGDYNNGRRVIGKNISRCQDEEEHK